MFLKKKNIIEKKEYLRDRVLMAFGSLCNLHSKSSTPPLPDELFAKAIELCEKSWELGNIFDNFEELEEKLMEKTIEKAKERKVGVYYASELYDYFTNKIPPEKFLEIKLPTGDELKRLFWGVLVHEGIQKLFGYEEKRIEYQLKHGIKLVGRIDLQLESGEIVEIKTNENPELFEEIPPRWLYQCTAYMKMLKKERIRLYVIGWQLCRKRFDIEFKEEIWEDIEKRIYDYHEKVLRYVKKTL
mgnify:CR=1 FL=1